MLRQFLSGVDLYQLPLIAMGIFLAMFLAVLLRIAQKARRPGYERMAAMPLDDGKQTEIRS